MIASTALVFTHGKMVASMKVTGITANSTEKASTDKLTVLIAVVAGKRENV
jgi:hypothetical protein